ncbi:hypothetical protein B9Z55_011663 [Caenorhabditis nigoni]|uniref:Uncharacterized protein n=1 Tax=Caenorhabditis nigoni TaxID=1611254 RepID=A0A2G5UL26_9PELO|nr:hypothetical protein B9Z55_011663 [Caenorhabditis nigoni]
MQEMLHKTTLLFLTVALIGVAFGEDGWVTSHGRFGVTWYRVPEATTHGGWFSGVTAPGGLPEEPVEPVEPEPEPEEAEPQKEEKEARSRLEAVYDIPASRCALVALLLIF